MNPFNYLDTNPNINVPQEWKDFYNRMETIYTETLQHNPFGPWNWHVISTTDIEGQIMDDKNYYDVAIIQGGMGNYIVCSMTKDGETFFFRKEGGSNGWDRYYNVKLYENWNPKNHKPTFTVIEAIDIINQENLYPDNLCQSGNIEQAKEAIQTEIIRLDELYNR